MERRLRFGLRGGEHGRRCWYLAVTGFALLFWVACQRNPEPAPAPPPAGPATVSAATVRGQASISAASGRPRAAGPAASSDRPTSFRYPAAARLVAIGDLHGDLGATRAALRLAGAIDENDRWVGGDLVVVQTGDYLDRGDDDRSIIELFASLSPQARAAGGALHVLNGNHEAMNVAGDFRFVTPKSYADFAEIAPKPELAPIVRRFPAERRGRAAAFLPGGPFAVRLAEHDAVIVVGDTVFTHGGVLPQHVSYGIERINTELRRWMLGQIATAPPMVTGQESPIWSREYSFGEPRPAVCEMLDKALRQLRAVRMVVGHTPQKEGINSACDEHVWRIDVGMSAFYGGRPEVLEIRGQKVRALPEAAAD